MVEMWRLVAGELWCTRLMEEMLIHIENYRIITLGFYNYNYVQLYVYMRIFMYKVPILNHYFYFFK